MIRQIRCGGIAIHAKAAFCAGRSSCSDFWHAWDPPPAVYAQGAPGRSGVTLFMPATMTTLRLPKGHGIGAVADAIDIDDFTGDGKWRWRCRKNNRTDLGPSECPDPALWSDPPASGHEQTLSPCFSALQPRPRARVVLDPPKPKDSNGATKVENFFLRPWADRVHNGASKPCFFQVLNALAGCFFPQPSVVIVHFFFSL